MNYHQQSLAEIVKANPGAISVFEKAGLDYCCNGNRNFEDACETAGVNARSIANEIETHTTSHLIANPATLSLDKLIAYIFEHHHRYLERVTPTIAGLLEKVCHRHGTQHAELNELKEVFQRSAGELAVHMKKEEFILFPFIKNLVQAKSTHKNISSKFFNTVKSPIQMMEDDHDHEGWQLRHMRALTNGFSAPAGACNSFSALYKLLDEYVHDLHQHIHLENNVLFPGAVALETELRQPL